jgi:hypothetical protein
MPGAYRYENTEARIPNKTGRGAGGESGFEDNGLNPPRTAIHLVPGSRTLGQAVQKLPAGAPPDDRVVSGGTPTEPARLIGGGRLSLSHPALVRLETFAPGCRMQPVFARSGGWA